VIVGGDSGPGARRLNEEWVRDIVRQCRAAGVLPFVKQMGSVWAREPDAPAPVVLDHGAMVTFKRDPKGHTMENGPRAAHPRYAGRAS
jgi:Protein of unknown function (DUF5131)